MYHHKKHKISFLVFILVILIVSFTSLALLNRFRSRSAVEGESTITSDDITVSATIGMTAKMIIYGYAPSSSKVLLTGTGISEERYAEVNGWFSFDNIHKLGSTDEYPEMCLTAVIGSLSTQPTCLPSLTGGSNSYDIGPVILSPIISIEQNVFPLGTQVSLNGVTIPTSQVNIYLAENGGNISFIPRALAYFVPTLVVTSDASGKFQSNLPSNLVTRWKVYASTTYLSSSSAKSNTLNFIVESNVRYYLTKIYTTITKTTNILTTIITTSGTKAQSNDATSLYNIPASEVEAVRSRLPYYVIFIEIAFIALLVLIFIIVRKRKRQKKNSQSPK